MPSFRPEILLQIFSFLSQSTLFNVVQISKQWNSIAIPFLWRKPRFKRWDRALYAPLFKAYGPFIRDVELLTVEDLDVRLVIDTCSNLTSAKFSGEITTQEISILCRNLSECLECLSLGSCEWDNGVLPYIATLRKLRRLELHFEKDLDDAAWGLVGAGCPLLKELVLSRANITDAGVRLIAQHLPHLHKLGLSFCPKITDASIIAIVESCPLLTSLHLGDAELTDVGVGLVAQHLPHLHELDLSFCKRVTDTGVHLIAQHLPHLHGLDLCFCKRITDASIIPIAESCPLLTYLRLGDAELTDAALFSLATAPCRETITDLEFYSCQGITNNGLRQIVTQFFHLQRLILRGCSLLTEDLFDEPHWKCTGLVELDIGYLDIGSSALFWVSKLTSLTTLCLEELLGNEISEAALLSLAKLPNLKNLDLSGNRFIDDDLAKWIAESCSLANLDLRCTAVSKEGFKELSHLYPNMLIKPEHRE